MMKIENYYLDLNKVRKLDTDERIIIHDYYKDMMHCFHDGRKEMSISIMNTLTNSGYLLDNTKKLRDDKINDILDGDKS